MRICAVLMLASLAAACPPAASDPFTLVIAAQKAAAGVVVNESKIAYTDGLEASSDGQDVGVDVVVAERGAELLRSPADVAVRGMALGKTSVATLELRETVADQRVRIRPLAGGDVIEPATVDTPMAVAVLDDAVGGYLWVEARLDSTDGADGLYALSLVESDEAGAVRSRTAFDVGEVRMPFALLEPLPAPFGLAVGGDDVFFGWRSDLCHGGSVLYRASRSTGGGSVEWTGRVPEVTANADGTCECDTSVADNVVDRGHSLSVLGGVPVVVGGVADCASVVDRKGFVRNGDDQIEVDDALLFVSGNNLRFAASAKTVFTLSGTRLGLAVDAPDRVAGLAFDGAQPLVAVDAGVFRMAPPVLRD